MRSHASFRSRLTSVFRLPVLSIVLAAAVVLGGSAACAQLTLPGASRFAAAAPQPKKRSISDRNIAKAVTHLLNKEHLTRHPLDNEISGRAITLFLKSLDPMKLYFYQSDVD